MTAIGIDLGTSNSLICFWDGEKSVVIPSQHGNHLVPSVVGIDDDGEVLVGEVAKERLITHPEKTAATFKRFMGTDKVYQLGTHTFSPIELSALVLRTLKQNAELYLKEPCTEAIISVPAYFNNAQREATLEAAKLAGLTVSSLISEPTAAAVAYGLHQEDQTILVVDLGGGTFDVSLLELFDGIMQVEAISGDNQLGGEDFTQVLILDFTIKNGLLDTSLTPVEQALLYRKMEQLKLLLGKQAFASIAITIHDVDYTYEVTVSEYEKLCQPLLNRLKMPIIRVLNDGHLKLADIDHVILVGGATKGTIVRNYFAKLLKTMPYTLLEPDETVAYGVGIQASLKEGNILKEEMILTDVCGHSMGVESMREISESLEDGWFTPIIERNTTIPVSKEETFYSIHEQQTRMRFHVYQGESPKTSDNLKIGELVIEIPSGKKDYPINCRFTYDTNGLLEIIVTDEQTGKSEKAIIEDSPGTLTPAEITASLAKLEKLKVHPKDRAENRLVIARLERLYAEHTGAKRQYIQELLMNFQTILNKQDEILTKRTLVEYTNIVNQLESELLL